MSIISEAITYSTPPPQAGSDKKAGLNSKFSFSLTSCPTKPKEPNLPYYLPIAVGRKDRFMPFSRALVYIW